MDDIANNQGNAAPMSLEMRGDPGQSERPVATEARGLRLLSETAAVARQRTGGVRVRDGGQAGVYEKMVSELKGRYKISIRKWRKHMSGVAYELKYRDGRIKRLITAPRPRSPVSASIFLHEVGHHAVGFHRYSPRCLEEYYVWQWALREMTARGIAVDAAVLRHYRRSMHHYVRMAMHQGQSVPQELHPFIHQAV